MDGVGKETIMDKGIEDIENILNKVYMHGWKKSTDVINVPDDEMTISDAVQALTKLVETEKRDIVLGFVDFLANNFPLDEIRLIIDGENLKKLADIYLPTLSPEQEGGK